MQGMKLRVFTTDELKWGQGYNGGVHFSIEYQHFQEWGADNLAALPPQQLPWQEHSEK